MGVGKENVGISPEYLFAVSWSSINYCPTLNAFPLFLPVVYFFKVTSGTKGDFVDGRSAQSPKIRRQLFGDLTL
jgi:hypothetical protein